MQSDDNSFYINLLTDNTNICSYDNLFLYWNHDSNGNVYAREFQLTVSSGDDRALLMRPLIISPQETEPETRDAGIIKCARNANHCVPLVRDVIALTDIKDFPRLKLVFNEPTDEPTLVTTARTLEALDFDPPLIGSAIGSWVDPSILEIIVEIIYLEEVIAAFRQGRVIKITPKLEVHVDEIVTSNNITIRPTEPGPLQIFIVNSTSMQRISNIIDVRVNLCDSSELLPSVSIVMSNEKEELPVPNPMIRIRGIVPVDGKQPIKFLQSSLPAMVKHI